MESEKPLLSVVNNFCRKRGIPAPEVASLLAAVEANDADAIWLALAELSVPPEFYEDLVTTIYDDFTDFAREKVDDDNDSHSPDTCAPTWERAPDVNFSVSDAVDEAVVQEPGVMSRTCLQTGSSKLLKDQEEHYLELPGFVPCKPTRTVCWKASLDSRLEKREKSDRAFSFRSIEDALNGQKYFSDFVQQKSCVKDEFTTSNLGPLDISAAFGESYVEWKDSDDRILIRSLRKVCRMRRVTNHLRKWPGDSSGAKAIAKDLVTTPDSNLLMDCVEWSRKEWQELANQCCQSLKMRSADDVRARFINVLAPWNRRCSWTETEDSRLQSIATSLNERDWVEISRLLGTNRSPFACLERYRRVICPPARKATWSASEDEALKGAVQAIGFGRWQEVALCLGGYTGQQCLHRWRKICDANSKKKGRWSSDEVEALKKAIDAVGRNWVKVAKLVPGRTEVQCREKWVNTLDNSIRKERWTTEEDTELRNAVGKIGLGKWSQIAQQVVGRTDNQCLRRWKRISKAIRKHDAKSRRSVAASRATGLKQIETSTTSGFVLTTNE